MQAARTDHPDQSARRRHRMSIIARAGGDDLRRLWRETGLDPQFSLLRGPETGLVMLSGRIGGSGAPFNIGEATATRASVKLENGMVGHALLLGRDAARTQLAAVIDALAQVPDQEELIDRTVIAPLEAITREADTKMREETAATRVDFFTLVRGDDQ